jgi:ABC-2 type transport system permease protein
MNAVRPLYWSIRREVWENRSLWIAPLFVAAVFLFGFFLSTFGLPRRMRRLLQLDAASQRSAISMPFNMVAFLLILTAFVIGVFYCLEAMHGERRDRSILFWKSLPVSDKTAVLAKAGVPLVVLPLVVFTIVMALHVVMLMLSSVVLIGSPRGLMTFWTHIKFMQSSIALMYALVAVALWHAPIYAWLLLVSAWAKRATVLWALLPLLAVAAVERMTFNTSHVMFALAFRLTGWFRQAFAFTPKGVRVAGDPLARLQPFEFLTTPGLWIGLVLAALFLAAAARLRRNREPI